MSVSILSPVYQAHRWYLFHSWHIVYWCFCNSMLSFCKGMQSTAKNYGLLFVSVTSYSMYVLNIVALHSICFVWAQYLDAFQVWWSWQPVASYWSSGVMLLWYCCTA
jgi:hypothetical protein